MTYIFCEFDRQWGAALGRRGQLGNLVAAVPLVALAALGCGGSGCAGQGPGGSSGGSAATNPASGSAADRPSIEQPAPSGGGAGPTVNDTGDRRGRVDEGSSPESSVCAVIPANVAPDRQRCEAIVRYPWFAPAATAPVDACRPEVDASWLACERDADCVAVERTDCPICNGGAVMAVNRRFAAHARRLSVDENCRLARGCTEMICEDPPSVCASGRCSLDQQPTGTYCGEHVPCTAGLRCVAAPEACGGGQQCLADGERFLYTSDGSCSWGAGP